MKPVKSITVSNPIDEKHMDSRALETEWVDKVIAQTTERLCWQLVVLEVLQSNFEEHDLKLQPKMWRSKGKGKCTVNI